MSGAESARFRLTRLLSLALMGAGSLLLAWALTPSAVGDAPATTTTTNPAPPPADESTTAQPAPAPPSAASQPAPSATASAAQPASAPVAVTAKRAKASSTHSVTIVDFAFNPSTVTVHTGDTVLWTNTGTAQEGHNVTGDGLNSGTMPPGATYSATFSAPGTFNYICTIHPDMKGSVQVLGRAKAGSGGSGGSSGGSNKSGGGGSSSSSSGGSSGVISSPSSGGGGSGSGSSGSSDPGSSGSLPKTGTDSVTLADIGLLLIVLGMGVRIFVAVPARRDG